MIAFLTNHGITYNRYDHPAVFTVEEAEQHRNDIHGMACKNLFLRSQDKKRYFLLVMPARKQTDLKKFAALANVKKVSLGNPITLKEKLGLEPGSVSPFGLINDKHAVVELYLDSEVYDADSVCFHPNVNTATMELSREMFDRFLGVIAQKVQVVNI